MTAYSKRVLFSIGGKGGVGKTGVMVSVLAPAPQENGAPDGRPKAQRRTREKAQGGTDHERGVRFVLITGADIYCATE